MTWSRLSPDVGSQRAFLVERYLSPTAALDLHVSTARVARLCGLGDASADGVRYLTSVYLPVEDTCFCLFQAPSADAVRAINDQANFPFDRLVDAVLMFGAGAGS